METLQQLIDKYKNELEEAEKKTKYPLSKFAIERIRKEASMLRRFLSDLEKLKD